MQMLNGRLQFRLVLRILRVQVGGATIQTTRFRLNLGHEGLLLRQYVVLLLLQFRLLRRLDLHFAAKIRQLLLTRCETIAERFFLQFRECSHHLLFYSMPRFAASWRLPSSSNPLGPFLPTIETNPIHYRRNFFLKRLHRLRE